VYVNEIQHDYVRPYGGAVGVDVILIDDNAQSHRALVSREYIKRWIWIVFAGLLDPQTLIR